jgi:hypothetical protein
MFWQLSSAGIALKYARCLPHICYCFLMSATLAKRHVNLRIEGIQPDNIVPTKVISR